MASKGPRSKLDHDSRARCRKALEAPREPHRPKTHWDHVLEEMVWLSKDFESERKWKIAHAKKVALRASKGMLDQATRGEKKMKEEEQRMRKVALSITKDVKKFWTKIEKLVLYKHQLEVDDKKKKALDKQLEYLLGQTERYSTMLAENLLGTSNPPVSLESSKMELCHSEKEKESNDNSPSSRELHSDDESDKFGADYDYEMLSEDDMEDDEQTIEEDEALITEEERKEELAALQNEVDIPLEELLKHYTISEVNGDTSPEKGSITKQSDEGIAPRDDVDSSSTCQMKRDDSPIVADHHGQSNGFLKNSENHLLKVDAYQAEQNGKDGKDLQNGPMDYDYNDDQEDDEFLLADGEEKDDEATLEEEEELAKVDSTSPIDEIGLLQKESEIPLEELLARYKGSADDGSVADDSADDDDLRNASSHLEEAGSLPEPDIEGERQATPMAVDDVSGELPPTSHSLIEEKIVGKAMVSEEGSERENTIADAAAAARSAQPTGNTFLTTSVRTKFPFLVKYPLREYQHIGLDWLVTMYEKRLNGILADEMGLGKTIMTIALLAHLACEKGIWGPHLIVVPTSVMLNWETEFLKWCPAFKILTYFGSAKERKYKRQGWMKPNYFHVCITTYRLVIQDSKIFKRKKWKYLILDEAHLIKNWKSQRWQTLLNFNSKRRILLTGTPLQNDLMELWSLMHFLMPHVFQSHQEFKDWFCNPISGMVEGQEKVNVEVIDRLHNVLRPFILRRLKRDVETQLPMKREHVIYCRLSRRQRNLYEDFIASSTTQATLASSNFFGMLNVIMQLRKVCNHPDLFEGRPIVSSFDMAGIERQLNSDVCSILSDTPFSSSVDLSGLGLVFTHWDFCMTSWESDEVKSIATPSRLITDRVNDNTLEVNGPGVKHHVRSRGTNIFEEIQLAIFEERLKEARDRAAAIGWWNSLRCQKKATYSTTLRELVTVRHPVDHIHILKANPRSYHFSSKLADIILSPVERFQSVIDEVESFMFSIPAARAPPPVCWSSKSGSRAFISPSYKERCSQVLLPLLNPLRPAIVRRQLYFPDRRLLQFDCGKLQQLAVLLRRLKSEGHRALIFTQMTKMLDILEAFINLYGYTYMRLDGSTQPEERQTLMQRFNTNPKIFLFILSTRSGGVGINLVGADTVIFYDSDWNPAMDMQAQDRCHRIGQTREVHIYRLISESTIEENILKKANQKRALDDLVIQSGGYNTEFFKKLDPMDLFSGHKMDTVKDVQKEKSSDNGSVDPVSNSDLEAALRFAEDEADYMALKRVEQEEAVDNQEFTEETFGRLEDDDLANEDDVRVETADQKALTTNSNKETEAASIGKDPEGEKALAFFSNDEDVDMLADVKQMAAAAAAAGHAISSFENQLRPIDRYAMRFLEMWDPIIDKAALADQTKLEETEWELDRIEKLKDDMEAEIDEDEEPFVYERWDADFATQAYRQQVEVLAQHQLMEDLERKAREQEILEDVDDCVENEEATGSKPKSKKSKKNSKKIKFKSLKSDSIHPTTNSLKEENMDYMLSDDENTCSDGAVSVDMVSSETRIQKKRKAEENTAQSGEKILKPKAKKTKKIPLSQCFPNNVCSLSGKNGETKGSKLSEVEGLDSEWKSVSRNRVGKIMIPSLPTKMIIMIRQEKPRKKVGIWSSDCFPSPDVWLPQEDAVLCALVHEYGSNWSLVSDSLYGMTAGGFYRGRFRHPFHCCERFRELVQKFVLSVADNLNDKTSNTGAGKALLKVSEENVRALLEAVMELHDREMLLQKHFTALLSSTWRMTSRLDRKNCLSIPQKSLFGGRMGNATVNLYGQNIAAGSSEKIKLTSVSECRRLVSSALRDANSVPSDDAACVIEKKEGGLSTEILEVTLELGGEKGDGIDALPSAVTLSILGPDPVPPLSLEEKQMKPCQHIVENRFRNASNTCITDGLSWAGSAFSYESRFRPVVKLPALGKHKLPAVEVTKSSRSKARKTAAEPSENHSVAVEEPLVHSLPEPAVPHFIPNFDLLPPVFPQDLTRDFNESTHLFGLDMEFPDAPSSDLAQHCFIPDFISDLEDCPLLPEFTDIG